VINSLFGQVFLEVVICDSFFNMTSQGCCVVIRLPSSWYVDQCIIGASKPHQYIVYDIYLGSIFIQDLDPEVEGQYSFCLCLEPVC